ncbi:MAG: LytR C-terminal domain-containing protein, partial [Sciscionella sp.]
ATPPFSRGKIAGLALLGVAVVALVLGIVSLGGAPTPNNASAAGAPRSTPGGATTSSAPVHPSASTAPSSNAATSGAPTSPPKRTGEPTTGAPPETTAAPPAEQHPETQPQAASAPKVNITATDVRVYNNSTVTGLAARAAQDFTDAGYKVSAVSNWPYSNLPTTTAYYRPGTVEQPVAEQLAKDFGTRAQPRFRGIQDASPGVIVIVTSDYNGS